MESIIKASFKKDDKVNYRYKQRENSNNRRNVSVKRNRESMVVLESSDWEVVDDSNSVDEEPRRRTSPHKRKAKVVAKNNDWESGDGWENGDDFVSVKKKPLLPTPKKKPKVVSENDDWETGDNLKSVNKKTRLRTFSPHMKAKILVAGHTWVNHLKEAYQPSRHNPARHEIKFCRIQKPQFQDVKEDILSDLTSDTTHVLIFSIFRLAFTLERFRTTDGSRKEYRASLPNSTFRAENAVPHIRDLINAIRKKSPGADVYIMLPTFPDLNYYNYYRKIVHAPEEVQNWYKQLPRTSPKEIWQDTLRVYEEIKALNTTEYRWPGKRTILLTDAVRMDKGMKKIFDAFTDLTNESYSLGSDGYLVDGIHPSLPLIHSLWKLLRSYGIFEKHSRGHYIPDTSRRLLGRDNLSPPSKSREPVKDRPSSRGLYSSSHQSSRRDSASGPEHREKATTFRAPEGDHQLSLSPTTRILAHSLRTPSITPERETQRPRRRVTPRRLLPEVDVTSRAQLNHSTSQIMDTSRHLSLTQSVTSTETTDWYRDTSHRTSQRPDRYLEGTRVSLNPSSHQSSRRDSASGPEYRVKATTSRAPEGCHQLSLSPTNRILARSLRTPSITPERETQLPRRRVTPRRLLPGLDVTAPRAQLNHPASQISDTSRHPYLTQPVTSTETTDWYRDISPSPDRYLPQPVTSTETTDWYRNTSQSPDRHLENTRASLSERIPMPTILTRIPIQRIFEIQKEVDICMDTVLAHIHAQNSSCTHEELLQVLLYHAQQHCSSHTS